MTQGMTIKRRLLLSIAVTAIASLTVGALLVASFVSLKSNARQGHIAQALNVSLLDMQTLSHEYAVHDKQRALKQWDRRSEEVEGMLGQIDPKTEEAAALLSSMRAEYADFLTLFDEIVRTHEASEKTQGESAALAHEREEWLAQQLSIRAQSLGAQSLRLHEQITHRLVHGQQRAAVLGVLFALASVGFATSLSLATTRRVTVGLERLKLGAQRIASGDLGERVELTSGDELGQLGLAFNEMAVRLSDTYADLEAEVAERRRAEERARFESLLLDRATDSIIVEELDGSRVYFNEACYLSRGFSREEFEAMADDSFLAPHDPVRRGELIEQLKSRGEVVFESPMRCRDGSEVPYEIRARLVCTEGREVVVAIGRDITERQRAEETIRRMAYYDTLTGLANRMLFEDRLTVAIEHARRTDEALGVLYLDIDHFKHVNDTLGHGAGDQLLMCVADRLRHVVRDADTVSRQGGDEFTLLLPGITSVEDAVTVAEKILDSLRVPVTILGHELHVSASIGVAMFPTSGTSSGMLLKNADAAMYAAKSNGRGRVQVFDISMTASAMEGFSLKNDLRRAIDNDELEVCFQPQIRMTTGEIVGAEALVRWRHPSRGLLMPATFIPLAEESGFVLQLGDHVLDIACHRAVEWGRRGWPIRVAVNLSAWQFLHSNVVDSVRRALEASGLEPGRLELEITETVAMGDAAYIAATLAELDQMGVSIALDDFGIGHSSLEYLQSLPVDTLKVARPFIDKVCTSPESAAIVSTIVILGQSLGMEVVAEGVETEDQLEFLRARGCDEWQGFLCSPAVSSDEFSRLLSGALPVVAAAPVRSRG